MSDVPLKSKTLRNGLSITSLLVVASCRASAIKILYFAVHFDHLGMCVLYCLSLGWSQTSSESKP